MKTLVPAVATAVMSPPQMELNTDRVGPFDVLRGPFSSNVNEFFERCRLNGSLLESEYGSCYSNGTCDGQEHLLQTGAADFSLFGLSAENYEALQNLEVRQFTESVEVFLQSLPHTKAYRFNSDVLYAANQMSLEVHITQMMVFVAVYLLINISCMNLEFTEFIRETTLFGWFMQRFNCTFRAPHRKIVSVIFVFNSLVFLVYISCAFNAEMVVENHAKYYESLEDVVKHHKNNRTPVLMVKNLIVARQAAKDTGSWRALSKQATWVAVSELTDIPLKVASGAVLVSNTHIIFFVRAFLCAHPAYRDEYQLLRESKPLMVEPSFMFFSANASRVLKDRVSRLISLQFQAGIVRFGLHLQVKSHVTEIFSGSSLQIHRCEGRQRVVKWPSNQSNDISLANCSKFIIFYVSLMSIASIIFVVELLCDKCSV